MQCDVSFTQVFYQLLDCSEEEQQKTLDTLKQSDPSLYQQVAASFADRSGLNISKLIHFHAQQFRSQQDTLDLSGQSVDKYQLIKPLGQGGMGQVYQAKRADQTFEQSLAIKFIHPALNKVLTTEYLYLEAQVLARLNHPHITKVYDAGTYNSMVYMVMEKVDGQDLTHFIERSHLTRLDKLRLFANIASAIAHAHQNQILHADIKPENILIDALGKPKIIDFNLMQKAESSSLTLQAPLLAYSEKFASPEQKSGAYLTNQSDIYSLGKLLAFMLPHPKPNSDEAWIINKATQVEAEQRYSSVEAMMEDVNNILSRRPISLKKHQPVYVLQQLIKRKPTAITLSALLVVSLCVFSITLVNKNRVLNKEKAIAEEMIFEMTHLLFHSKQSVDHDYSVQSMLELTRRRVLANPELPRELKQKMLLAMMTPVPERASNANQHSKPSAIKQQN